IRDDLVTGVQTCALPIYFPFPRDLDHCAFLHQNPSDSICILYGMANQSHAEQFDKLYGRLWTAFFKADAEDLTQHERQLLHHIRSEERRVGTERTNTWAT